MAVTCLRLLAAFNDRANQGGVAGVGCGCACVFAGGVVCRRAGRVLEVRAVMQAAIGIHGLPWRWGAAVAAVFHRDDYSQDKHARKFDLIHEVQNELQLVPIGTPDAEIDAAIYQAGESAARECYRYCERYQLSSLIVDGIFLLCLRMGVPRPTGATEKEIIARAVDRGWWVRKLRTEHKRRFEHASIQLGMTWVKTDPYISRESAARQARYNAQNQKLLESITATNGIDEYTLAQLAALGPANKAIRRGELMLRIRGCEEIANEMRHVAVFWTITCPSKFHSVGGTNKNYNGATPRDAQAYLCKVWQRIRAAFKREGMQPYGFRIAEPHSDGCPHWHMLLFIEPEHEARMTAIINKHALAEDGEEKGAKENRVKLVRIEAGKGTAAGYIVKYVSKNIDGHGVGDHKAFEDGRTYVIATDMFGDAELTASERVTYWSQVWGIRQFQQIGGAPVGVWREMRRVKAETVAGPNTPADIRAAWDACQKIESDDPMIAKRASFAGYIRAQGGPNVGRRATIRIATRPVTITGRYAVYEAEKPVGVYSVTQKKAVFESVRYTWTIKEGGGVAVAVPWTCVNNCTQVDYPALSRRMNESTKNAAKAISGKKFAAPAWVDWPAIVRESRAVEKKTKNFIWGRDA